MMDRIGVGKWRCPQAFAPLHGECLRQFFSRESQSLGTAISVDELQVSEFMQEHVIEDETPDCKQRPFLTTLGAELPGCLALHQGARETYAPRQRAERNLTLARVYVAQYSCAAAAIIEVHGAETLPQLARKTGQHNADIFLRDVVDPVAAGTRWGEPDSRQSGI